MKGDIELDGTVDDIGGGQVLQWRDVGNYETHWNLACFSIAKGDCQPTVPPLIHASVISGFQLPVCLVKKAIEQN